ncbi:hypothetical protein QE152_g28538 [Popillia japonica]|uniref:Transposase IS30-like HTH domain-containing protein n=1 Tax=Popillia japonica TaxID=7064 RepID=A0AAW1JJE5_POPJA
MNRIRMRPNYCQLSDCRRQLVVSRKVKMNRIRMRPNYCQLSDCRRIIGLHEGGIAFREIARRMQRNTATVIRC